MTVMHVTVSLEQRFDRTPDGRVWASGGLTAKFWEPYLRVFDGVRVVARVQDVAAPADRSESVEAPGVSFAPIPAYVGPAQHLARLPSILRATRAHATDRGAYILRVPSTIGGYLAANLKRRGHPYAVEVIGDPFDVFAPGVIEHPLRPLLRTVLTRQLRRLCNGAAAGSYVTERTLQARYPCGGPSFAISDVHLEASALASSPRTFRRPASRLIFVGSLEQLYKAPDVLIDATALLAAADPDFRLTIVGDGKYRSTLQRSAAAAVLGERLRFLGWVSGGEGVRRELDQADIFVLPSRTEGLPRAMLEAMGRGLPCIGSRVGGIPELLGPEYLVSPGDAEGLAEAISRLATNPEELRKASALNIERAAQFSSSVLGPRRAAFYAAVRELTLARIGQDRPAPEPYCRS